MHYRCTMCNCMIYRFAFVINNQVICNSCMQNNFRKTVKDMQENSMLVMKPDEEDNNEAN